MTIDKKELTKLSPEERIKRLKLMEEERKKEVNEIEELIKKSMQELRTDKLAEEVAPGQRTVDISRLFEPSGEQKLERTAREESTSALRGKGDYQAFKQTYQDYSNLKRMMGYAAAGTFNQDQLAVVDEIGERLDRTKYQNTSAEIANMVVASIATLHKIKRYAGM